MKIIWTQHSQIKMKQYGLSKTKIINLIHKPERVEEGIAMGTTAMMKTNQKISKSKKTPGEVWLMYKDSASQRKIISCWRYPGITKPGEQIPIPEDIKVEILKGNF